MFSQLVPAGVLDGHLKRWLNDLRQCQIDIA